MDNMSNNMAHCVKSKCSSDSALEGLCKKKVVHQRPRHFDGLPDVQLQFRAVQEEDKRPGYSYSGETLSPQDGKRKLSSLDDDHYDVLCSQRAEGVIHDRDPNNVSFVLPQYHYDWQSEQSPSIRHQGTSACSNGSNQGWPVADGNRAIISGSVLDVDKLLHTSHRDLTHLSESSLFLPDQKLTKERGTWSRKQRKMSPSMRTQERQSTPSSKREAVPSGAEFASLGSHSLYDLRWPFDTVLSHTELSRSSGGTQPQTTGTHGFPQFVTAGPNVSLFGHNLFGYDREELMGPLLWA